MKLREILGSYICTATPTKPEKKSPIQIIAHSVPSWIQRGRLWFGGGTLLNPKKSYKELLLDPRWQKKRLEIFHRDCFTCRWCGDRETNLHVHHEKYIGDPWDVPNSLLITVCDHCHKLHHYVVNNRGVISRVLALLLPKRYLVDGYDDLSKEKLISILNDQIDLDILNKKNIFKLLING